MVLEKPNQLSEPIEPAVWIERIEEAMLKLE